MSNIHKAFDHGKAFIGFLTGGDPTFDKSAQYLVEMARAGADLIEIGVPFSDPIAEGPTIQEANLRALAAGMTTEGIFRLVERVREETQVPLVLLTYLNPVFKYGYQRFFARCAQSGVDGIIIPDCPHEERGELLDIAAGHGVDVITLIAPTSDRRVRQLATSAKGFVYTVSSMGVTGVRSQLHAGLYDMLESIRASTDTPVAVGFGINTPQQAGQIARAADGVIVGSALVQIVERLGENAGPEIHRYVREMKDAVQAADNAQV